MEEDIILLKDFIEGNYQDDKLEYYRGSYKMGFIYYKDLINSITNILNELERLQVLEDDIKDKRIVYIDTPEFEEQYIPKQVIRDKIEEIDKRNYNDFTREQNLNEAKIEILNELKELLGVIND